ncbi:hypothetical protein Ddc_10058 [Ditylenchus destructor]|nr:hypothetical protein Ddc_10058 [Ditylenchus destructor]
MDKQNILCRSVKRRQADSPPNRNKRMLRKKVDIPDDTWLETLKFLTCRRWMQKCFVSRQINGIAQRNISRLPKVIVDSVEMYYIDYVDDTWSRKLEKDKSLLNAHTVVAFDTVMQEKQSTQWFKNHGFTLDAPSDIPAENAIIGARKVKDYGKGNGWNSTVNVRITGPAQEKIVLSAEEMRFPWFHNWHKRKPVLFYAQFNPFRNQYSWNYLAQFLNFIFHPSSYLKEVKMYAVEQKFIESLQFNIGSFDNEPRYIRCESFSLEAIWPGNTNIAEFSNVLKWMTRNVRAETIRIPKINCKGAFGLLTNFLLDPPEAKQCASKEILVSIGSFAQKQGDLLSILIEKFHTIPFVESAIPTIKFCCPLYEEQYLFRCDLTALGRNLIDQEVDSQGANALYMISNGQNRMRISFRPTDKYKCYVSVYSI